MLPMRFFKGKELMLLSLIHSRHCCWIQGKEHQRRKQVLFFFSVLRLKQFVLGDELAACLHNTISLAVSAVVDLYLIQNLCCSNNTSTKSADGSCIIIVMNLDLNHC